MFILFFWLIFVFFPIKQVFFQILLCTELAGKLVKNKGFWFSSTDFVIQWVWVSAKESSFLTSMPGNYYGYDSQITFLEILFILIAHAYPF